MGRPIASPSQPVPCARRRDGTAAGGDADRPTVALVHDYLTQRGGAERVVLSMVRAFPGAPLYTSLFDPEGTFPDFSDVDVRVSDLNRFGVLRRDHRRALPFLASAFSRMTVEADVVLCSSSGWAHHVTTAGRKVVYCHNPARFLYQADDYLPTTGPLRRAGLRILQPALVRRDRASADTAFTYLVNSSVVSQRVATVYGREAVLVPPPPAMAAEGPRAAVEGLSTGFVLNVSRLMAYKNVDVLTEAFRLLPRETLVVVGTGPEQGRLESRAPANVRFLGAVDDASLRWLYGNCSALASASFEDFGLTPLEAAAFGRPSAVLRAGGFLDTVVEGRTGVFFEDLVPEGVASALTRLRTTRWDEAAIRRHADGFSEARFIDRLRDVVASAARAG